MIHCGAAWQDVAANDDPTPGSWMKARGKEAIGAGSWETSSR